MVTEPDRIARYARNGNHVALGLGTLSQQFKGKPAIAAVLTSYLTQVQAIEDAVWQVMVAGAIDGAAGDALDQVGAIVLQPRAGLSDAMYRTVLRAAILANRSAGTGDQLLAILVLLLGGNGFALREFFPAALLADPAAPVAVGAALAIDVLRRAKAGGVALHLVDPPAGSVFAFASGEFPEIDGTHGFGDIPGTTGGAFAGVVT